jgi:hypothetical protein
VAQNPIGLSTFGRVSVTGTLSGVVTTFILGEQLKKAVNNNRLEKKIRNFIGKKFKRKGLVPKEEQGLSANLINGFEINYI